MMRAWITTLAMALAFVGPILVGPVAEAKKPAAAGQGQVLPAPDGVVLYETTDADMNAAIAEAQRWVPAFLADFRDAPAYDRRSYSVKVGLPTPFGGVEHIWVDALRFEGDQLVGSLANSPVELPGMRLGSRVVVDQTLISDWTIIRGELAYGGYTMRVMLDDLPRQDADALRAVLSQDPVPPEWRP